MLFVSTIRNEVSRKSMHRWVVQDGDISGVNCGCTIAPNMRVTYIVNLELVFCIFLNLFYKLLLLLPFLVLEAESLILHHLLRFRSRFWWHFDAVKCRWHTRIYSRASVFLSGQSTAYGMYSITTTASTIDGIKALDWAFLV